MKTMNVSDGSGVDIGRLFHTRGLSSVLRVNSKQKLSLPEFDLLSVADICCFCSCDWTSLWQSKEHYCLCAVCQFLVDRT